MAPRRHKAVAPTLLAVHHLHQKLYCQWTVCICPCASYHWGFRIGPRHMLLMTKRQTDQHRRHHSTFYSFAYCTAYKSFLPFSYLLHSPTSHSSPLGSRRRLNLESHRPPPEWVRNVCGRAQTDEACLTPPLGEVRRGNALEEAFLLTRNVRGVHGRVRYRGNVHD
jgi:hypothetical protein